MLSVLRTLYLGICSLSTNVIGATHLWVYCNNKVTSRLLRLRPAQVARGDVQHYRINTSSHYRIITLLHFRIIALSHYHIALLTFNF